jgi:sec-independent protein translocase protein TatB
MGGLDPAKLLVILVLALVLIGPDRLPRAAKQLGAFWRDLMSFRERMTDEVRSAIPDLPEIPALPKRGVSGYLTAMMNEAARRTDDGASEDGSYGGEASPLSEGGEGRAGLPSAPAGVPAGWGAAGATVPGYASGSVLSAVPAGLPEGRVSAEVRLDLDDPSWN